MTQTTSEHGWTIPTPGGDEDQWGTILNDFFDSELDRQVTLEDTYANRPAADNTSVKLFLATDRRIVYYNDGTSWEAVYGLGTDANPVPGTSHFEAVETKNASVTNDFSHQWEAGTNVDASRSASTTYQNTTGKMLKVYIRTTADTTGTTSGFQAFVAPETNPITEGYEIAEGRVNDPTSGDQLTGSFEVPPDQYYELTTTSATIGRWNEKESTSQ